MDNPKVVVCTLSAERRIEDHSDAIPHILSYDNMVYHVNYEGQESKKYATLKDKVNQAYPNATFSRWTHETNWLVAPKTDQDQARLTPICIARNMCRQFSLSQSGEFLLFVDSDVVVPPDSIQKLLEVATNPHTGEATQYIVGGMVPGRGVHKEHYGLNRQLGQVALALKHGYTAEQVPGWYAFWPQLTYKLYLGGQMVEMLPVQHGTCGFMMIHRHVYERLSFTTIQGDMTYTDPMNRTGVNLSEDPAYGIYARRWFGDKAQWLLRTDLVAEHLGDLKADEVAQF